MENEGMDHGLKLSCKLCEDLLALYKTYRIFEGIRCNILLMLHFYNDFLEFFPNPEAAV